MRHAAILLLTTALGLAAEAPEKPPAPGALALSVKDAQGRPLAARFQCIPERGEAAVAGLARGEKTVALPAGKYRLVVSRGPAYTLYDAPIEVSEGAPARGDVVLERVLDTAGLMSLDPSCAQRAGDALALEMDAEDLDAALSPRDLGAGVVWNARDPGGAFYGTALCPWSGIPADETTLAGVWALGFDHDHTANAWWGAPGEVGALRPDWFHLLARGRQVALLAGSGPDGIVGLPRLYVTAAAGEAAAAAVRRGPVSLSWGILVRMSVDGSAPGTLVPARFGGVALRVTVQAPPWVETDEVTVFAGGEPVMRTDLRPEHGKTLRLDRVYFLRSNRDTFYVAAASGAGSLAAYAPRKVRPLGIAGPVWVDAEGDGSCTPAQDYAAAFLARYRGRTAAALDAFRLEPLRVQIQAASLSDDAVLLDHLVDDIAQAVRFAALGNLRRNAYAWAPDIFARRLVKNDREIIELAETTAGLCACGATTALDNFARNFAQSQFAERDDALQVLALHGNAVAPEVWQVVGPFGDPDQAGMKARFGPEQGVRVGQPYRDFQEREVTWRAVAPRFGTLHLEARPEADVHYAVARFTVSAGGELGFVMGSGEGLALWIDGEKVLEKEGREGTALFATRSFARGDHEVMLKIPRARGEGRAFFGVLDPRRTVRFEAAR